MRIRGWKEGLLFLLILLWCMAYEGLTWLGKKTLRLFESDYERRERKNHDH